MHKHVLGFPLFNDDAVRYEYDPVRDFASKGNFVGDDHHREAVVGELPDDSENFPHQLGIKGRRGFVKKEEIRFDAEGAGNRNTLLAARKALGVSFAFSASPTRARRFKARSRTMSGFSPCTCTGTSMTFSSTVIWGKRLKL